MESNILTIRRWVQSNPTRPLTLKQDVGQKVGYGIPRATGKLVQMSVVRVVVKLGSYNGMPYYILTSYLLK